MYKVDLNSDLGESFGAYQLGMDSEIINCVTSVNVACGWHAGDPMVMEKTVKLCKENRVAVGAHPGYPDLLGFGRRQMKLSFDETRTYVKYQLGALMAFTQSYGVKLQHVSPHGAMGNYINYTSEEMARAVCTAVAEFNKDIIVVGNAGGYVTKVAEEMGLCWVSQVYADRAYNDDYSLVARGTPGAMIHDPDVAVKRVVRMVKEGKVTSINGKELNIQAHGVCVHGDTSTAVQIVKNMRAALAAEGIVITNLRNVIS